MALCDEPTCLGLPEWTDCCSKQLEPSMEECLQFAQFVSEEELAELSKGYTPKSTEGNTKWALNNFFEWMKARNRCLSSESVPCDILSSCDSAIFSEWLSRFAIETRNSKGKLYPPSTIYQLLTALLRHMRATNPNCPTLYMYRRYCQYISIPKFVHIVQLDLYSV